MSPSLLDRITLNPDIAHGKPAIRNKRYTVEGLLEYLAGGDSVEIQLIPDFYNINSCFQIFLILLLNFLAAAISLMPLSIL